MKEVHRIVLDTSVFTNPEIRAELGSTPTEALLAFLDLARGIESMRFFLPASVWEELNTFLEPDRVPPDAELVLERKSPAKFDLTVPAVVLYELIDDVRRRVDKGLRVAEELARQSMAPGADEETIIQTLRRRYRESLREGIIDSTEDVELILLAKEMDAVLVSADRGVTSWAEKLGIRTFEPRRLPALLRERAVRAEPG